MPANTPRLLDNNNENDDRDQCTDVTTPENGCPQEPTVQQRTALPVKQLFVLCLMRFAEPISFSVIFPFVNQMIEELGVTSDPKELGYYSGFVEGVFALAQFCTVCFWGSLSDRIGRRPVLIVGLCGVITSTIMFGLSKSFPMMLVSRALSGALNGNVAVIKSVLGEITDETNQGVAFAYLPLCWSIGSLMAPAIGGFLSHPAERYPSVLGYDILRKYPYLLPCLVGSVLSTIGLIAGILFLEETLPKNKPSSSQNGERRPLLASNPLNNSRYSASPERSFPNPRLPSPDTCGSAADDTEKEAPSVKEIMRIPSIRKVLFSYGFMAYVTVSINAVLVLWLYTPVNSGGIGFDSAEIGATLTLSGIFGTAIAVIVFPPLERRVGAVALYRFGMVMQVLNVLAFPLSHALALAGGKKGAYLGAAAVLVVRCIASMVFVCNMLLVTRSAPCRRALGTVNGLAQMVASASRAVGPAIATSLFALSVKNGVLGGNLVWLVLSTVAFLGVIAACYIPKDHMLRDTESNR
ncbi:putative peptide/nitrate transporter At3g43790 OS=Arabidopsis thaliana GN=ZIFL2 PE=2 SV=2 [Rhizoctonia solani AG-1 IB]|uniref:Putative peptide/nitrate transporter At3g43790 n=1 Tax=Thanatephorus cucumeris (strain AG1-IB / isolate 7/3/14) TaxID=1108050 RepID=A0A0B7G0S2_THACB|nr:putative peptide/nitrate transporter At3g43790 OS=Arabidopsis thaliana GN=ZIFL2 PE=2 SV=2 [Rhizoctonia solani AG-1 IB]